MDHTIALIRRAHEGDENARAQLVEENTGLIWCVVKRFYGRGTEAEDLFQIGSIGLLKAIDKFDLGYDVKFSTYAVPMITGEIKRFLRDDGMLKVSRSLKEIAYKAYQAKEALTEKLGREPLLEEIAEETGVEKEELVMAMEAAGEVESLHRPVGMKDGNEVMLLEKIADTGGAEEKILDHLLPEGTLLSNVDKDGKEEVFTSDESHLNVPMAVLINEDSYSAAELFAAVLHEYGAATTIGTNTVGKGYYQNLFQLEDGSAVDLSVGRYFTSKGENLEGIGLTPDVEVDLSDEDYAALYYGTLAQEDDAPLQAAVELLMKNVVTP